MFPALPIARLRPVALALLLATTLPTAPAHAQAGAAVQRYDIPAGPLDATLTRIARQAGRIIAVDPTLVAGRQAPAVQGDLSLAQAFAHALAGSGLGLNASESGVLGLRRLPAPSGETTLPAVSVTARSEVENPLGPTEGYIAKRSTTGAKTDTPIVETPQSISVVTADFVEAIGATRLTEALAYTPGVRPNNGFDSRYDTLNLRGFDSSAPGFYLDGLQLRNNASYSPWRIETYGLERIEVLRGPSSVLYGQNTPGGTINAVSKRPTAEPLRELQVQVGNHARRQLGGDFSGPLDEDGTVLYRITGFTLDSDTQVDHMSDERQFIAPSLTIRSSSDTTLTLLSHYERIRSKGAFTTLPAEGTLLSNPNGRLSSSTFTGEPDFNRFDQDQWAVGYAFEHRFNDAWTFRQNTRYGHLKLDYWDLSGGSFITVDSVTTANPANYRLLQRNVFGALEESRLFTIDNQLQAQLRSGDWSHTILMGLDYQHSRYDQLSYWGSAPPLDIYAPAYGQAITIPAPNSSSETTLLQAGLYLQDQIKFQDRWALTLGGRYDRAKVSSKDRLEGNTSSQTDEKFSGRAGLVYLAPSGLAPYVSYSESFSPLTTINPDTGKPFEPETGRQYEAGLRYQPPGRSDSYSAAIFELIRKNYLTFDSSFSPRQTGEITLHGLEFEAVVQPLPKLNLVAAYTFTPKADVTESSRPGETGKQMQAVPRNQLALWADYTFSGGLKAGLGARYTGSTRGYGEQALKRVPSYTLVDGLVSYETGRWLLALNARNLTDKKYLGANCDAGSCSYGERRQVLGTATYRF